MKYAFIPKTPATGGGYVVDRTSYPEMKYFHDISLADEPERKDKSKVEQNTAANDAAGPADAGKEKLPCDQDKIDGENWELVQDRDLELVSLGIIMTDSVFARSDDE